MDVKVILILFLFYTFAGAIVEHLSYAIGKLKDANAPTKALSNPIITGFPIYGIGALMIIWLRGLVIKYNIPLMVEVLLYTFSLFMMELLTGSIVKAGASSYETCEGKRCMSSWDYSKNRWNFMGIVDIRHIILFGIAGFIVSRVNPIIQSHVEKMFSSQC